MSHLWRFCTEDNLFVSFLCCCQFGAPPCLAKGSAQGHLRLRCWLGILLWFGCEQATTYVLRHTSFCVLMLALYICRANIQAGGRDLNDVQPQARAVNIDSGLQNAKSRLSWCNTAMHVDAAGASVVFMGIHDMIVFAFPGDSMVMNCIMYCSSHTRAHVRRNIASQGCLK